MRTQLGRLLVMGLLITFCCATGFAQERREASGAPADVLCGIDVLKRDNFKQLAGRKVALITNQTGRDRDGNSTVELLAKAPGVKVTKLFSPEHGLYGNVDEKVGNTIDPRTGLKVYSLYGKTNRPSAEMLEDVDTLVYDIQDVGARFYTYSATLGLCMQEAGKHNIRFVVLDRPNPITGTIVDGPIADQSHFGFTAFGPMPVSHGMTFGELAQLYNGEWNAKCDLQVIKCEGWKRQMWWDETGLLWVNPSPNMRNVTQALLYPAVCLLEATNVSVGRGTDQPFELFGASWIDARKLAAALNGDKLPGLRFVPIEFTPTKGSKLGEQMCHGVYILVTNRNEVQPVRSGVTMAWELKRLFAEKFEFAKVERLLQNKKAMEAIAGAKEPSEIENVWAEDLSKFRDLRQKYLIYE